MLVRRRHCCDVLAGSVLLWKTTAACDSEHFTPRALEEYTDERGRGANLKAAVGKKRKQNTWRKMLRNCFVNKNWVLIVSC